MPRPGSVPPPDAEIVSYASPLSCPTPLRSTPYGRSYPAPPDAPVTTYRDESGKVRYSDRPFNGLVEDAIVRQKERDREAAKVGPRAWDGYLFGTPAGSDDIVEVAYAEQMRRVEQVRRERPSLSVAEALVEIERYGAGKPEAQSPPPADPHVERYGSHLAGKDRSADPGVCIAAWVPWSVARNLAVAGAVPADEMDVTLCYLGRRSKFTDGELDSIASVVKEVAAEFPPLKYKVDGTGTFPPSESSDGKEVLYAVVQSEDLMVLRRHLAARLADAGFEVDSKHGLYTPHVTIAYVKPGDKLRRHPFAPATVAMRQIKLAIGDSRKTFSLTGKRELYAATVARARKVLYGLAAARYASTGSKGPQGSMGLFQDEGREPTPMHVPPFRGSPAHMPSVPSSASGRTAPTPAPAPADPAAATAERVRKGLAAIRKNRRRRRPYDVPGNGRIPPTPEPTLVRSPRKPPAGSGPARAEVPIPTAAPAEKPPVFLQATPIPRPSAPAPAPVRNPAALPSQARPDRTTDVSTPRPTPALSNNPAPAFDAAVTQPPGFTTPGQPVRGSVARQNAATPQQLAAKRIWESVFPPGDSIGGRESKSGLQMQPGSAGLKPVTNPAPPVSGLPRKTRSEQDRSRDGGNSIL